MLRAAGNRDSANVSKGYSIENDLLARYHKVVCQTGK
jgi:hypothetical protein